MMQFAEDIVSDIYWEFNKQEYSERVNPVPIQSPDQDSGSGLLPKFNVNLLCPMTGLW